MSFLAVHTHDGGLFRFEFQSSSVRIGRSSDNDLQLDDPTVSRLHAMLEYRGCPYQKPHPPSESLYPCHAEYTPAPTPINKDKRCRCSFCGSSGP